MGQKVFFLVFQNEGVGWCTPTNKKGQRTDGVVVVLPFFLSKACAGDKRCSHSLVDPWEQHKGLTALHNFSCTASLSILFDAHTKGLTALHNFACTA